MSSVEAGHPGNVAQLLVVTAALECGAGLALLVAPAPIIRLLFGAGIELFPAVAVARLTGVALLSLGAACWWARPDARSAALRNDARSAASRAVVQAMLVYNVGVPALVLFGGLGALGLPQWAAVVIHGAMGIWCARTVTR